MNAQSVQETVTQLEISLANFNKESAFYRRIFSNEKAKVAWEDLRQHCQQLSQWIEHGKGVNHLNKFALLDILWAAEEVLTKYRKFRT